MVTATIIHVDVEHDTNHYRVTLDTGATVLAVVTASSHVIDQWLTQTTHSGGPLIVGFVIEWGPNLTTEGQNPAAILQLCVAKRCLVVLLLHAELPFPPSLSAFLQDRRHSFVGLGVAADARKLMREYFLAVSNTVELGDLAAFTCGNHALKAVGLPELAQRMVGLRFEKPTEVLLGGWEDRHLSSEQVAYACVDAYASYLIGETLINRRRRH